jgi:hypothetical protein
MLFLLQLLLTILAETSEFKLVIFDPETGPFCYLFIKFNIHGLIKIKNLSTLLTPEMIVIVLSAFISAYSATEI